MQNISPPKSLFNAFVIFLAIYQSQNKHSRLVLWKNLWMRLNCLKAREPLSEDSLLFTTKSPGVPLLISMTVEGWKAESTLESISDFELKNQQLLIQRLNQRSLHELQIQRFLVRTLIIYLTQLWDPTSFQGFQWFFNHIR